MSELVTLVTDMGRLWSDLGPIKMHFFRPNEGGEGFANFFGSFSISAFLVQGGRTW